MYGQIALRYFLIAVIVSTVLMQYAVATPAEAKDNGIYTPAEESTARANAENPGASRPRNIVGRVSQKMIILGGSDGVDRSVGSKTSQILDSIFQIPIQTLKAVNNLVQNILGGGGGGGGGLANIYEAPAKIQVNPVRSAKDNAKLIADVKADTK